VGGDEVSGLGTQCPLFRKSYVGVAIRLKVVRKRPEDSAAMASYSGAGVVFFRVAVGRAPLTISQPERHTLSSAPALPRRLV
jgi:hypothetical protein